MCHLIQPEVDDLQAVGALPRRRRLPEVPHQARRLQLPHPQPAGRSPTSSCTCPTRTSARSPPPSAPTTACSATPSRRSSGTRSSTTSASTTRACARPATSASRATPTSAIPARSSRSRASRRTRCRSARAATTASSCPTTAASATSAARRRRRSTSPSTGKRHPDGVRGVPSGKAGKAVCADCHHGLADAASGRLDQGARPHRRRPRQEHLRRRCHLKKDPTFCIDCHGLEMPHPGGWLSSHGSYALKDDNQQKCVKCHGENSCIKCHGLQMPHPAGWLSQHSERARSATRASAPSATAARSASAATASSCRTAAPSSPTTRTTCTPRAASA